ncbi:MAG: LamG-like jellyroll fold domain-containing protein [Bacteroidales bacterium]
MKKLIQTLIFSLFSILAFGQYGIYEMIVYYPIDHAVSGDTIFDISEYETHGIMHNVELVNDRFGKEKSAISFNGYDSYISLDCPYFAQPEYCYSLWVKVYSNPDYGETHTLISIGANYGVDHFLMNTNHYSLNDHLGWLGGGYHKDGTHAIVRTQIPVIENEWMHLTYFRDSEILKLYINGELVASSSENVQAPFFGAEFFGNIGRRVNGTQYFFGAMDDIRIFERILKPEEIMESYLQQGIPEPLVTAGSDLLITPSDAEVQTSGRARLYKKLNWYSDGDGTFSDSEIENPVYYLGPNDLNAGEISLILSCIDYSDESKIISDTIKLLNPSNVPSTNFFGKQIVVTPNPVRSNNFCSLRSESFDVTNLNEINLVNIHGQIVSRTKPEIINSNELRFNVGSLSAGVYSIKIKDVNTGKKIIVF